MFYGDGTWERMVPDTFLSPKEGSSYGAYPVAVIGERLRLMSRRVTRSAVWSWREESNLQPAVYKTAALPIELRQLPRRPGILA